MARVDAPCDKQQGQQVACLRFAKSYKQPPAIVAQGNTRHHPVEIDYFVWSGIRPTGIISASSDVLEKVTKSIKRAKWSRANSLDVHQ